MAAFGRISLADFPFGVPISSANGAHIRIKELNGLSLGAVDSTPHHIALFPFGQIRRQN